MKPELSVIPGKELRFAVFLDLLKDRYAEEHNIICPSEK